MPRQAPTAPIVYTRAGITYRARVLSRTRKRPDGVDAGCFYWRVERPTRRVLGWLTRDDAQDRLIDLARAGQLVAPPPEAPEAAGAQLSTLGAILDAWIVEIGRQSYRSRRTKKPLAASTRRRYTAAAAALGGLRDTPVSGWTQAAADRWILERITGGASRDGLELQIVVLTQSARWAHREGYLLAAPPALELPGEWKTAPRRSDRCPEREEVLQIIEALEASPRAQLGLRLLFATGARPGEVCALRAADVEQRPDGVVYVHLGRHAGAQKTGGRTLPLSARLGADLLALAGTTPIGRLLHTHRHLSDLVKDTCQAAKVEHFPLKGLRYLKTRTLMDAQVDPARYEAWMGHSWAEGMRSYRRIRPAELVGLAELGREPDGRVYPLRRGGE